MWRAMYPRDDFKCACGAGGPGFPSLSLPTYVLHHVYIDGVKGNGKLSVRPAQTTHARRARMAMHRAVRHTQTTQARGTGQGEARGTRDSTRTRGGAELERPGPGTPPRSG